MTTAAGSGSRPSAASPGFAAPRPNNRLAFSPLLAWRESSAPSNESPKRPWRNLEGYVRSPARAFDRHEGRPHISRIERSRGPVSRYGESAGAVLVFEALSTLQGLAGGDHGAVRRRRRGFGRSLNA